MRPVAVTQTTFFHGVYADDLDQDPGGSTGYAGSDGYDGLGRATGSRSARAMARRRALLQVVWTSPIRSARRLTSGWAIWTARGRAGRAT